MDTAYFLLRFLENVVVCYLLCFSLSHFIEFVKKNVFNRRGAVFEVQAKSQLKNDK